MFVPLSIYPGNTAVSKIFSCCQPSSLIFLKLNLYWGGCGRKFGENNGYLTWHSHYSALWRLGKWPPGWISWKSWVWVVYRMRISKIYIHVVNYYEKNQPGWISSKSEKSPSGISNETPKEDHVHTYSHMRSIHCKGGHAVTYYEKNQAID